MHKSKRKAKIKGHGASGKTIVLGAIERTTLKKASQVRTRVIKERDRETLKREISDMVEKGAILYTDGHDGYDSLNADYVRLVIDLLAIEKARLSETFEAAQLQRGWLEYLLLLLF